MNGHFYMVPDILGRTRGMSVAEPRLNYEVAELFSRAGERRRNRADFFSAPVISGPPCGQSGRAT